VYSLADFDYHCPPHLIAQRPRPERGASRLLRLDRSTGRASHGWFKDFPSQIESDDVLVVNTSRVINARLRGVRENGREAEILLIHPEPDGTWLAMVHPGGKLKTGRTIQFGQVAELKVEEVLGGGVRRVSLSGELSWDELMQQYGEVPIPPYIGRTADRDDAVRYQTVYAREPGSVAAPTAGLHFTSDILDQIRSRGARIAEVLLHIGPGTFKPVSSVNIDDHTMHREWFSITPSTAQVINGAKAGGGRIWAVGTTVTRVLETSAGDSGVRSGSGWTDLFIHPPYRFRVTDALLTNFHLPRSTLLMLVCAFGGYDAVMRAYRDAVSQEYLLYSYGDAMIIV
jgi:S-adenosylmethionine:tRNA ribosyltransferase-isomerase